MNQTAKTKPQKTADAILGWLDQEGFRPGMRIPAERQIAAALAVGRTSVRTAMNHLEQDGYVRQDSPKKRVLLKVGATAGTGSAIVTVFTNLNLPATPAETNEEVGWMATRLRDGFLNAAGEHGCNPLFIATAATPQEGIKTVRRVKPLGAVVIEDRSRQWDIAETVQIFGAADVPLVIHGDTLPPDTVAACMADIVVSDQRAGAQLLTEWLIAHGHRKILRCDKMNNPNDAYWLQERHAGHADACRAAGLDVLPALSIPVPAANTNRTKAGFEERIKMTAGFLVEALRHGVDAVMTTTDQNVYECAAACRLLGVTPGDDICIVGYDNTWALCPEQAWESYRPPVTIDKQDHIVGRALLRLLLEPAASQPGGRRVAISPLLVQCSEQPVAGRLPPA